MFIELDGCRCFYVILYEGVIYPLDPLLLVVVVGGVALKKNKYVNMRIQFARADYVLLEVCFLSILFYKISLLFDLIISWKGFLFYPFDVEKTRTCGGEVCDVEVLGPGEA